MTKVEAIETQIKYHESQIDSLKEELEAVKMAEKKAEGYNYKIEIPFSQQANAYYSWTVYCKTEEEAEKLYEEITKGNFPREDDVVSEYSDTCYDDDEWAESIPDYEAAEFEEII